MAEGRSYRGWAMAELGQAAQALAELEAAAAASTSISLYSDRDCARHLVRVGRADQALVLLDENLARFERSGSSHP